MSVNFEDINNVSDLMRFQKETEAKAEASNEDTISSIMNTILDYEPSVGHEICQGILHALIDFHENGVETYIKEEKPAYSAQWAADHAKLSTALDLVKEIVL